MVNIVIPKVHVKKFIYIRTSFQPYPINNIVKMAKQHNIDFDNSLRGKVTYLLEFFIIFCS